MAIKNINLINNKNYDDLDKQQFIQALANLGQREGISGDSLVQDTFTFLDCLKNKYYSPSEYIGYVKYNRTNDNEDRLNSCSIGVIKKDENNAPSDYYPSPKTNTYTLDTLLDNDIFGAHRFIDDIELQVQLNNIQVYKRNSVIKEKDGYLYTLLFGKIFGTDEDEYNIELIYNKFRKSDNVLEYALRLFHFSGYGNNNVNGDGIDPVFCLIELDNTQHDSNEGILRVYKFDTGLFNNTSLINLSLDNFNIFFNESEYNKDNSSSEQLFNIDISDINEVISESTIFGGIMLPADINNKRRYQIGNDIPIKYNTDKDNQFFVESKDWNSSIKSNSFNVDKNGITIEDRIKFINNDIIYLYPKLLQEYDKYYVKDISTLYQKIILAYFDTIIDNVDTNDLDIFNGEHNILYIPLDYKFSYYRSSSNEFMIYVLGDIFVNLFNIESYISDEAYDPDIFNSLCFSGADITNNKTICMRSKLSYNKFNNLIDNIDSTIEYTLPYIDSISYNWKINEIDTGITSITEKYDKQYIIILLSGIKSDNNSSTQLLNNLPKIYDNMQYTYKSYQVNPYTFVGNQLNIENGILPESITIWTAVPNTENGNTNIYKNALIVSLTTNDNIDNDSIKNSNTMLFSSLWKYNEDNNEFEVICDENNDPIDLSLLFNIDIAASRYKNSSNYIYDQYIGLLLNKNKFHQNVDNNTNKYLYILYGENYAPNSTNSTNINNLSLGVKCIITKDNLDISENELSTNLGQLSNLTNNSKYFLNVASNGIIGDVLTHKNLLTIIDRSPSFTNNSITGTRVSSTNINRNNLSQASILSETQNTSSRDYTKVTQILPQYFDFSFKSDIPILNNEEILYENNNFINRINILTLDGSDSSNSKIYNTIIGSELLQNEKSKFVIKSSNRNINIGNHTLLASRQNSNFAKQDEIEIGFDKITLNGPQGIDIQTTKEININSKEFNVTTNAFNIKTFWNSSDNIFGNESTTTDTKPNIISYKRLLTLEGVEQLNSNYEIQKNSIIDNIDKFKYTINSPEYTNINTFNWVVSNSSRNVNYSNYVSSSINIYSYWTQINVGGPTYYGFNLTKYFKFNGFAEYNDDIYDSISSNDVYVSTSIINNAPAFFITNYTYNSENLIFIFIREDLVKYHTISSTDAISYNIFTPIIDIELQKIEISTTNSTKIKYIFSLK